MTIENSIASFIKSINKIEQERKEELNRIKEQKRIACIVPNMIRDDENIRIIDFQGEFRDYDHGEFSFAMQDDYGYDYITSVEHLFPRAARKNNPPKGKWRIKVEFYPDE
jgi:hypothetical protein